MPTIRNSEQARRLAEARWRKHREREAAAVRLAEAWADDPFPLAILTKSEQERMIAALLRQARRVRSPKSRRASRLPPPNSGLTELPPSGSPILPCC
jgi:hypothetical protein